MTVATYSRFKKSFEDALGTTLELVSTSEIVQKLRSVKDKEELVLLTRAIAIADQAMDQVAPTMEPGMTESMVAWEIEKSMRELGAEAASFDVIVGTGPNGALPNHRADHSVIKNGDSVVIDMGALYMGYCSDLTRTFVIGDPDDTFKRIYDVVLEAQLTAEEKITDSFTGGEADAIARDIITECGF